uniref:Uncharacterized protein n=1 Tax=Esox lucius TaxID=8010 RepID=A0A6Q2YMB9_ESOLU
MSKASRLARPSSAGAGSKLPSPRKEAPGGARARVVSVGEKLMRAGSDGTPAKQRALSQSQDNQSQSLTEDMVAQPRRRISPPKASALPQGTMQKQTKSNLKVTSPEDSEHLSRRQGPPNGTRAEDPKGNGSRTVPRRHTLGGARSSREILAMQPSDMDKKREAFLEHLKQKYPHHASAIMGHQERLREQHGPSSPSVGEAEHLSLASLDSLETMSEADAPTAFTRGSRSRASLPVVRSTNQTRDRSLGVLYLQYGDDTQQIRMPNEITSGDTIRALFVSAFPQQLTMKMLESPSVAIYVKDDLRNMYYELTDVRNITDHSCLKVYHKDPAQAFSHGPRPTNGDTRMHREMYVGRDGQHPLRHPPMGPPLHPHMQVPMSPPTTHSMPPSPSRIPFGQRQGPAPCSATMPRERVANATPPARSASPCPSAILERRDVKPDEDVGGKAHSLARGGEGLYADPYLLHNDLRMGHAPPGDMVDHGSLAGYHRASIRSAGSYSGPSPTEAMDQPTLYRQKSRKYGDSQLPTLGSKTPPPSPHRMAEVRMIDIHVVPNPHGGVPLERASPIRQSFRKEEAIKGRGNMSPVVPDLQGHGPIPAASDPQTRERMKAMEQQIASLTGLVQHALLKSPNSSGTHEHSSEPRLACGGVKSGFLICSYSGGSPILAPKSAAPPSESGSTQILPGSAPFHSNLLQFKKNVSDLRLQLHQMRQLQLQNQEALRIQLKRAEQEISEKLAEAMRRLEDPVQRQRALVEEERHKYLGLEERVLDKLGELEQYVDSLKRDTGSAGAHRSVTLKDVEEGAVNLRRVGESLAGLKGEFPALQTRMRSVLRVEVEAVKFLKEEPHKLDSMLKRVRSLTETLSGLRRCATEGLLKGSDPGCATGKPSPAEITPLPASPSALLEPQSCSIRSEVVAPSSPVVIHHVQSAPVQMQQFQHSAALLVQASPPTHNQGRDSPGSAKASTGATTDSHSNPSSQGGSPAQQKKSPVPAAAVNAELVTPAPVNNGGNGSGNLFIEEIHTKSGKSKNRAMSIEAAEKEWEERRQNIGHYDGREFERILSEAQANMMKGIPSLEVPSEGDASATHPASPDGPAHSPKPAEPSPGRAKDTGQPDNYSDKPALSKPVPDKLAKLDLDKPPATTKPSVERSPKTPTSAKSTTDKVGKVGLEKASRSPPPPPPRKTFPTFSSGMTTTRSGEVVYTGRKDSATEKEETEMLSPGTPSKPTKGPAETTAKPSTPPPVATSAVHEEEVDEGDKIMAELQVFQKCTVKDVGVKSSVLETSPTRVEAQIKELRPGALLPLKEKKVNVLAFSIKFLPPFFCHQQVIYYVTGQISKDQPPPPAPLEEAPERRDDPPLSPSQNATSIASPTSRMPVPLSAKSRQSPGTTTDKAGKQQKLQDSAQRQFRQANGSAKRAGGDHKTTSPTVPASKIPAFYPSSGKGSTSQSAPNSDATNPFTPSTSNPSCSPPHTAKSSIPSLHSPRHPGSSHIPSLSNGSSLKLPTPSHAGKAFSFSSQTQNGRAPTSSFSSSSSSSSSSPSPLSPTSLGPGVKSIRTIHTPSFTSYRPQNGSGGKSCIPTATTAKDST